MIAHVPDVAVFEEGDTMMLACCAVMIPNIQYAWIKTNGEMTSKAVGVNSPTLFIPGITQEDMGIYACLAFGDGGTTQSDPIVALLSTYGTYS